MRCTGLHNIYIHKKLVFDMKEDDLMEFGFSKNEAKVYLALVDLGSATGSSIAERSKVHRTNVYDAIERLIEKGLVSYVSKDKTRYFEVTDPKNLMNLLKSKEDQLKRIMPELLLSKQLSKKTEVQVSEGVISARNALMNLLNYKQDIFIFGVPKEAPKVLGDYLLERYHNERVKAKIFEKVIYNEDAIDRITQLKKTPLCEVKVLPKDFNSPMSINICGDEVFFALFSRDPCLIIQIKSKDVAEMYKKYFDLMWNISKKV